MKRLTKISFIVLIPIVVGFLFTMIGTKTENEQLLLIGSKLLFPGIPIVMFLLVLIGIILMATGKLSDKDENNNLKSSSTREEEYKKIDDVNSSRSYESHRKQGEYMIGHVANNYKNSTLKEKILGWLFLLLLMSDFALIFIFTSLRMELGIYISFAIFALTIFIAVITKIILERKSINVSQKKIDNSPKLAGKVDACVLSSTISTGGSDRRRTIRMTGVTYKVIIMTNEKRYIAYSKEFYEKGEWLTIAVIGKNRAAIISKN